MNLDFRWIKASDVLNAARWDDNKAIDHDYLDELATVDFLFLDGVDVLKPGVGHTGRADLISLDVFFANRKGDSLPTIVICSDECLACARNPQYADMVVRSWGVEFLDLITETSNIVIELQKRGTSRSNLG